MLAFQSDPSSFTLAPNIYFPYLNNAVYLKMAIFADLPFDTMLNIFNRCSLTGTGDCLCISASDWERDLQYLAVCHNLRAAASCVQYRVAFLHISMSDWHSNKEPKYGRYAYIVAPYTNIDLIRQNGVSCFVHKADIDILSGSTASARLRCLYYAITGETFACNQSATTWATQAVTQFVKLFPHITELSLECLAYEKSILAVLHALCSCYADGLHKLNYGVPYGAMQPLQFTSVKHMVLRYSTTDKGELTIAPDSINTLSLESRDYKRGWKVFCVNPNSTTITFSNLEELRILQPDDDYRPSNSPDPQIYAVEFPNLRKLVIMDINVNAFLTRVVQQSPIRELVLSGKPSAISNFSRLGISNLDSLELYMHCVYDYTDVTPAECMNSILRCARGAKFVRATLIAEYMCRLDALNWKHLTHLVCRKCVSLKSLFSGINGMPDLTYLKVDMREWKGSKRNVCPFFMEHLFTFKKPFEPMIVNVDIFGIDHDTLRYALRTVGKFKYLFPHMRCLKLNNCFWYWHT